MSIYDAIEPHRAVLYADFRDQWDEIVGAELLTGDPYDPASWTAINGALLTRQVGAYLGGDALRVAYNGTPNAAANRIILTSGHRYRFTSAIRNNGGTLAEMLANTTAGLQWAGAGFLQLTNDVTANGTNCYLRDTGALGSCDFAALSVKELRRVTRNHGKALGAPSTIQVGDGFTASTMPQQLTGKRGLNFNGAQWLDADQIGATLTDNFTMYCCHNQVNYVNSRALIGRYVGGVFQWNLYNQSANGRAYLQSSLATTTGSTDQRSMRSARVTAVSVGAGTSKHFLNGNPDGISQAFACATVVAHTSIGSRTTVSIVDPFIGEMYSVAIYPAAHSQLQVAELSRRLLQGIRVGV